MTQLFIYRSSIKSEMLKLVCEAFNAVKLTLNLSPEAHVPWPAANDVVPTSCVVAPEMLNAAAIMFVVEPAEEVEKAETPAPALYPYF
jgi:hypothetical protein